jgi:hypothetical protein
MNPYQVSQAAYELNYILQNAGSLPLTGTPLANWESVFDASKAPPFAEGDIPLIDFELWRLNYNTNPVEADRTIPPATGADSTVDRVADAIATYNAGEEGAPVGTVTTVGSSGNLFEIARWFYNHGVKRAKVQGWNSTFKAIWDGALAQAQEVSVRAIANPDMEGVTYSRSLPLAKLLYQTRQQINKLTTAVRVNPSTAVSLHLLWGSMTDLRSNTVALTTSLSRLINGSGALQPGPALLSAHGYRVCDAAVSLVPTAPYLFGFGVQIDQAPAGTLLPSPPTVSGTGTKVGLAAVYWSPTSGTTNQIVLQPGATVLLGAADAVRQGQGSLAGAPALVSGAGV